MFLRDAMETKKSEFKDESYAVNFKSPPLKIDFIAYHILQAQSGESIYNEMSKYFLCNWKIGPNQFSTGSQAAIMLDHTVHHPGILKFPDRYKYLFYLSHDLTDFGVYKREKSNLRQYDIIFVPGPMHYQIAMKELGKYTLIVEAGWPKYDCMDLRNEELKLRDKINSLPYKYTLLYAPSFAHTYEWKTLLPYMKKLRCNIIIKNHVYIGDNQSLPVGKEELYRFMLDSAAEMEREAYSYNQKNILIIPRCLNICSLFPYVDVLISDRSSVLVEFLPYGISIETGRYGIKECDYAPEVSCVVKEVFFMNEKRILNLLSSLESFEEFIVNNISRVKNAAVKYVNTNMNSGRLIAYSIDRYISENEKKKKSFLINIFPVYANSYYLFLKRITASIIKKLLVLLR